MCSRTNHKPVISASIRGYSLFQSVRKELTISFNFFGKSVSNDQINFPHTKTPELKSHFSYSELHAKLHRDTLSQTFMQQNPNELNQPNNKSKNRRVNTLPQKYRIYMPLQTNKENYF